jgi:8-oxo-dGTP pyrophosphatase MutT (NUDIX family)
MQGQFHVNIRDEVQAVLFDKDHGHMVLLVQKRDMRLRRFRWRLLKGGINRGEAKVDALRREIFEETGMKGIKILQQIHDYQFVFKETLHRVSSFLVEADSRESIRLQESELSDYLWTDPESAATLLYWSNEREALRKLSLFSNLL